MCDVLPDTFAVEECDPRQAVPPSSDRISARRLRRVSTSAGACEHPCFFLSLLLFPPEGKEVSLGCEVPCVLLSEVCFLAYFSVRYILPLALGMTCAVLTYIGL